MSNEATTILVVDDTEAQRYAVARALRKAGFAVEEAGTGKEALELAQRFPDLILLDINLPDMDGFAVCKALKAAPATAHIPVIHISACFMEPQHKVQAFALGADDYIVQPVTGDELVAKVNVWLRLRRTEAELRRKNAELEKAVGTLKAQDEVLRDTEAVYRTIAHNLPNGAVFVVGPNLRFVVADGPALRHIDLSREQMEGRALREALPEDLQELIEGRFRRALCGETATYQTNIRERIVQSYYAPLQKENGEIRAAICLVMDITDRKRAEEALIQSEKLASVGRMAATIAHEINNPLEAVTNALFLARGSDGTSETTRHYLDIADEQLKRASQITRQALGFYREPTRPSHISVVPIMESALDLLKNKIKAKHAVVEARYEGTPNVIGVSGELRQVFANLLANSLDAIGEHGKIIVRIAISGANGSSRVRITVADTGHGICPDDLHRIFEPFFTTKESVGTGLGLWVSKEIVAKHSGRIRIHSRTSGPSHGTVFSITLPAVAGRAFSVAAPISGANPRPPSLS